MKKSIFLFFAAILCATGVNAKTIYLRPSSNWKEANAWFQVWDGKSNVRFSETAVSGLYLANIADNHDDKIYIKRMNPNGSNWAESEVTVGNYNCFSNDGWATSMTRSNIIGVIAGGYMLFDNSQTNWSDGYRYFVIGHDSYYKTIGGNNANTLVSNTKLWCLDANNESWADAKYFAFLSHNVEYPTANKAWSDIKQWGKQKTTQYTSSYNLDKNSIYLCIPSSGTGEPTFDIEYQKDANSLNKTITVKAKVSTDKGDSYTEKNSPGTLTASSFKFTKWNTCNTATSLSSGKITCGYTANTTLTAQTDVEGYVFAGWYNASGTRQTTDASLAINPTADATYYAYYVAEAKHKVTISYKCGSTNVKTDDTKEVGEKTNSEITAPSIDGYTFKEWQKNSGIQTSDALTSETINITTLSTGDYTLVAKYDEDLTTGWYLVGEFSNKGDDDTGWKADKIEFKKRPGESTGTVSYATLDLLPTTFTDEFNMMFKVVNGENNWYGNNGEYQKDNDKQDWHFETGKSNCNLDVSLPGTYTFCLNTNKDGKVYVNITYPIVNMLQIYTADPSHAEAVENWNWDSQDANEYSKTLTLNAETKYTFKAIINSEFYGENITLTRNVPSSVLTTTGGDVTLQTDIAGDYTFTWNLTDKKLTVTYPTFPDLSNQPDVIYFKPSERWTDGNARFAAFFMYGDAGTEDKWENLTDEDKDGIYQVNNEKKHIDVIFVRMNPASTENRWNTEEENSSENKPMWNQTDDLYIPMDGNNWFIMDAASDAWDGDEWANTGKWYQKVTVTATANPAEGGTVSGGGTYLYNNEVTLTATPNTGYEFTGWSNGEKANPYTFTAIKDVTISANFKLQTFTVKFLNYDGTELQSSSVNYGETPAYNGTTPVREADAQYTYTFSGWDPEIAAVTGDQTYTAQYSTTVNQYIVTATAAEGGTVTGAGTYDYGTSVTLTATANTGYEFVNWTEDGVEVSADAEYTLTVTENVTLTANFAALAPETYTRTVSAGNFGTICLPFGSSNYTGAEFYELVGQETGKVYIGSVTTLEAGVPYIFLATATEVVVTSDGTTAAEPGYYNGLYGTFTDNTAVIAGNYILYNNAICKCKEDCWVDANRAYIVWDAIPTGEPQKMPGRKYIGMGVQGENEETAIEDILSAEAPAKVIENGQLIIIRNGVKYNVQGQIVE